MKHVQHKTVHNVLMQNTVQKLLHKRDEFFAKAKRAVEISRNDPASGINALRFYADLLIKDKNADYLINPIILNQSTHEIYNLDIAAVALIVFVCLTSGIFFCLPKYLKFGFQTIVRKIKIE